jgi:hypothetical protein
MTSTPFKPDAAHFRSSKNGTISRARDCFLKLSTLAEADMAAVSFVETRRLADNDAMKALQRGFA